MAVQGWAGALRHAASRRLLGQALGGRMEDARQVMSLGGGPSLRKGSTLHETRSELAARTFLLNSDNCSKKGERADPLKRLRLLVSVYTLCRVCTGSWHKGAVYAA